MTFLAPLHALIALSVALPALLAFYFLRLRRRPVRVSSTMLWEDAASDLQVNVPIQWIRASWLLFLHLLILAFLVAAIGRPAIDAGPTSAERVLLLLDRSASMSAADGAGGRTRFEEARDRARAFVEELERAGVSPFVTVIGVAREAQVVAPPSDRRADILRAIDLVTPTDQPVDFAGAFELVEAIARPPTDDEDVMPDRPLAVLFSDGAGADRPLSLMSADLRFERVGPDPDEATPPDNLGIVAMSARRDFDRPALVRTFVRVQNTLRREISTALTVRLDGETVAREPVTVPGAADPEDGRDVEPGEGAWTLEFTTDTGGVLTVTIDRSDALASDNAAAGVLPPPTLPSILVVAPDDRSPDPFLTDVLRELRTRSLRTVRASDYASDPGASLAGADLVIFDRVSPDAWPPVPSLGFGHALPGLEAGAAEPDAPTTTQFLTWRRQHPVLRYVTLDTIIVGRRLALLDRPGEDAPEGVEVEVLAAGADGPLILLAERGGVRHVLVAFPLAQSNWPVHFGFPIFVASAVEHLSPAGEGVGARSFTTTEPAFVRATVRGDELRLRGPVERTVRVLAARGRPAIHSVGVLERAGVYEAEGGEGIDGFIAVNLFDAGESRLRTAEAIDVGGTLARAGELHQGQREIWSWLVLAALLLLAVEWLVYAARMRV